MYDVERIGTAAGDVTDLSIVCGDATPQVSTLNAQFNTPTSVALDSQGNVFAADPADNRVQKVAKDGAVSTVYMGPNPDSPPWTQVIACSSTMQPRG
jgi:hypothetical protein